MNSASISGVLVAVLGLSGLTFVLAADSHFPISQWPIEAIKGLVFSLVWGFGISESVAYGFSILVVLTIAIVCFAVGHKLARMLSPNKAE